MDRPKLINGTIDLLEHPPFRIGSMQVVPVAREVRFGDKCERIEPQPMKVLVALAARRGEVVTRDQLIESCWNGRYLGEDVINRAVLLLRRVATASGAFSIETVPKAGYRLTEVAPRPRVVPWKAIAAVFAVAGAAFYLLEQTTNQSHPPLALVELAPFKSSGDRLANETAQASDGILADMLASAGLPVLRPNRPSGQGKTADFRLSGQVLTQGGVIEADLQLDDLMHGSLLLSRRFRVPRDQAASLPEQIGAFAATSLASTGSLMALDRRRPGDRRLTGEVLRQWSMLVVFEDPLGAYRAVDRIAEQLPDSAVAQLGLAMSTVHVLPLLPVEQRQAALVRGRAAAARARSLAPDYGDVAWPDCGLYSPVRFAQCEASLRKAFAIDPTAPFVAAALRNLLVSTGRFREALQYDRLAVAAMPYMAGRLSNSTGLLEMTGERTRAERQFQNVRLWWPEFHKVFADRFEGMLDRGALEDAAAFVAVFPPDVALTDRRGVAAVAAAVAARQPQQLRARCLTSAKDDLLAHLCLLAFVRLGDIDGAFAITDEYFPRLMSSDPEEEDRLFLVRSHQLGVGVLSTPPLAPLRKDPRFLPLAERVGLLRYWRSGRLPDFCSGRREPVCRAITLAR